MSLKRLVSFHLSPFVQCSLPRESGTRVARSHVVLVLSTAQSNGHLDSIGLDAGRQRLPALAAVKKETTICKSNVSQA